MANYHIRENGEPGECEAVISCPLAQEHYPTPLLARQAYELQRQGQEFMSLQKPKEMLDEDMAAELPFTMTDEDLVELDTYEQERLTSLTFIKTIKGRAVFLEDRYIVLTQKQEVVDGLQRAQAAGVLSELMSLNQKDEAAYGAWANLIDTDATELTSLYNEARGVYLATQDSLNLDEINQAREALGRIVCAQSVQAYERQTIEPFSDVSAAPPF